MNNFAISSDGVGEALKRSASALKSGNNSLEESIGLITGMNTVLQDPEKAGTVLKTASMYIRSAKAELEEAGESVDGVVQSTAKLRELILGLTGQKVDIMQDPNTIKSTYQVYKELSEVWGQMSDINRASLLEALGGKRNANAIAALLQNFQTAEEAMKTAQNAAGSAARENEKQMESLQGKMRLVQASFEDFSNTLLNSKIFKVALSGVSGVLNGLTSLMKTLGTLPVALGVATAAWKGYQKAKELATEYKGGKGFDIRTTVQNVRDTIRGFSSKENIGKGVFTYTKGEGISLNAANAGVKEFTDSIEKMMLKAESGWNKVGSAFNNLYSGVKKLKSGNDTLNNLSKNIEKYKDASIAAMGSGDYKGAMKNNQLMNAYRNQLAKLYREMQASSPDAAAGMRDAYQQAMMGYGAELPQKSIPLWKRMSGEIATAKKQVIGMNVAEKAAVITTNVLGVSFKALKDGAVALGGALKAALGAFAIGMIIQGAVTLVDRFVNRYKNAAEEARNTAEASREVSNENRDVSKTVDDIVERYKEYGKASSLSASENAENRANLLALQKEITASVGDEVGQVDLVNGSYEQQLVLLEEIKKKRNEINQTSDATTIGNDIASSKADYQANKSKNFSPIKFDAKDKSAQRTEGILRNSQYAEYFGFLGNVVRPIIEGGDIDSTIDQLRVIMAVLEELQEKSVPPDDTIFSALAAEANKLKADLGPVFEDAQTALDNVITGEALSDPFDAGAESLEKYKTELCSAVISAANVKAALNEGLLTQEDINAAIEEFIQQNFPDEYAKQIRPLKEIEQITKSLFGSGKKGEGPNFLADFTMKQLQDQVEAAFGHGEELEIAYSLILDKDKSFASIKDLAEAVQDEINKRLSPEYAAEELKNSLRDVIGDDGNKTTVNSLKKLAKSTGINASDIEDFASKSEALQEIMDETGISAEFLARIFQREFSSDRSGAGIDSITSKSLEMNSALNGMEKALDSASKAKKRYDSEMSKGNSDEGFKSASEAFEKMYDAARTGNVGSGSTDFWAGANYLIGEDKLKAMGYDAQAVVDRIKEIAPLFSSAESAGLGLIQRLQKMANESGVVGDNLLTITKGENGGTLIDVRPENYQKIADELGISKDAFVEALNAAEKWAQVTTFSSNDVYNNLRSVGDVLDNTSGKFKNFASSEIIDTKNIGLDTKELEKFKQELNSTGNSYVFLELQGSAEDALKSLKDLDVATEKLNEDGSETGKWDIDTESLNSLLAALEYSDAEVKNLYDRLKDVSGMSDEEIADVMKDFTEKAKSGKGEVKGIREQLDAIKNKKVELEIEIKAKGANLDPTGKATLMPDTDVLSEFMSNPVLNPGEFNETMQAGVDMIENGISKAIDIAKTKGETFKKSLDIRDAGVYSEEYKNYFLQQMDLAHQGAEYLRKLGLSDTDEEVQKMKQLWYEGLQGMLDYDKEYYDARKSLLEDHISEVQNDPFGDAVSNSQEIISSYEQLYDEIASIRQNALAAGADENSEYVRRLTNEMKQAVVNIENAKRDAFKGQMSASQLNIDLLTKDRHEGESVDNIVAEYSRMMGAVEAEMSRLRAEGVSENNEYLMELKRQWYDYRDAAREAQKQVYQEQSNWARHLTQMQEYSLVGSSGRASMIGAYQNEQQALLQEISNLAAMGYRETDSEIYSLREQVAALNRSIMDVQKEIATNEANWAKHLTQMQEYSLVGSSGRSSMIAAYQNEQQSLLNAIGNLAAMGYQETDQEIYSLREQIAALNQSIFNVQKEIAMEGVNWAKHLTTMADIRVSRGFDPREMIEYYENEQEALQQAIYDMAALGYRETDQEIYSLREQIEQLNSSIMDATSQWSSLMAQEWQLEAQALQSWNHATPEEMVDFYERAFADADQRRIDLINAGFGGFSNEIMSVEREIMEYNDKLAELFDEIMQNRIKWNSYYKRQLDNEMASFSEYVNLIKEDMDTVSQMISQYYYWGFNEKSSEMLALRNQYLDMIEELKTRAVNAMSDIDEKIDHRIKEIERFNSVQMQVELSKPILEEQQREYEKLLGEMIEAGIPENSDEVNSLIEKIWGMQEKNLELIKRGIDDSIAASEHAISIEYNRSRYNWAEYVEEYRRMQGEVHNAAEEARAIGIAEDNEFIRSLQEQWWGYEDKVAEVFQKLVSDANEALQKIKSSYDSFFKAADEYAEYGAMSYDSYKSLLDLGPEYMAFLENQNGLLEINKKAIQDLIIARSEELAITTALDYVEKLRAARQVDDFEMLNKLTRGMKEASASTWDYVYAQVAMLDLTDSQYEGAMRNLNNYRSLVMQFAEDANTSLAIGQSGMKVNSLDDLSKSFDDFVKYVEEMIKLEREEMKDALDKQLDQYKDIVKEKKAALDLAKEEADYEQSVADQVAEIAKIQTKIDQLSLDDSREATAQRKKLEEDLVKATRKLADDQSKHAIDAAKDQLDADQDALEKSTKERKEAIDEETKSAEKLHRLAMDRIMSYGVEGLDKLLDEVLDWNLKAGNSLERNIKDTWQDILELVERYGSLVGAIEAIRAKQLEETVRSTTSSSSSDEIGLVTSDSYTSDGNKVVSKSYLTDLHGSEFKEAVNEMIENSVRWWVETNRKNFEGASARARANVELGNSFEERTNVPIFRDEEGRWRVKNQRKDLLYDNQDVGRYVVTEMKNNDASAIMDPDLKRVFDSLNDELIKALASYTGATIEKRKDGWYYNGHPIYEVQTFHRGGVAGMSTLKQDETLAKLQKGEMILNKERQKSLFKLVDLASYLSDKLGVTLKNKSLSLSGGGLSQDLPVSPTKPTNQISSSVNFAPSINVTISGGIDDPQSSKKYAKQIADLTLGNLKDAFYQRGITKAFASV